MAWKGYPEKTTDIAFIEVLEPYRRQGLAKMMIDFVKNQAIKHGSQRIHVCAIND